MQPEKKYIFLDVLMRVGGYYTSLFIMNFLVAVHIKGGGGRHCIAIGFNLFFTSTPKFLTIEYT